MNRLYKLLPLFFFLKACGSQDYGEKQTKVQPIINTQEWREDALALQGRPASVYFGDDDGCEPDTICIEASYFGRYQMQELADRYPEYFTYHETNELAEGKFVSKQRYVLETDLLVLEKNERLTLCGNENILISSEASGGGEITGSGDLCSRKDGALIQVMAPDIYDIRLASHGSAGTDAQKTEVSESDKHTSDGNPSALSIDVLEHRTPTRLCISRGSCKDNKELREKNLDLLETLGLYTRTQFRKWVHKDILKGTSAWPETNNFEVYPDFHCWFEALGNNESSALLEQVSASLLGADGLNGKDATKIWPGIDGADGGNAGAIEIATMKQKDLSYVADAKGGKSGAGSIAIAQLPGEGVAPAKTEWTFNIESKYRVFCKGTIEKSWRRESNGQVDSGHIKFTTPGSVDVVVQTRKVDFRLGGLSIFDLKSGFTGEPLITSDLHGRNGLSISEEELSQHNGKSGKRGLDAIPTRHEYEEPSELLDRLLELCPTCEKPLVLDFKDYKNTGDSDEKQQ